MDYATKQYINVLAEAVIKDYDISIPIRNIDEIVKQMGGVVEEKYEFDDFCDGTIIKTGDNGFRIAISPFQSSKRRSFTIAHELGHLFLHMGYRTNLDLWQNQAETVYRRFGTSEQEYQANEFAAAFLMPKEEYKKVLHQYTSSRRVDMQAVANYFNVSVPAATNRGIFLGYLA